MRSGRRQKARQGGFTYLGLLVLIAVMGVFMAAGGQVWQQTAQREKERELLFAGAQIRKAIGQYYQRTPGTVKKFPGSLEELLLDPRFPAKQRYLRKLFRDPMTGKTEWGLVKAPGGGIMGVYSTSPAEPLKKGNFAQADREFEGMASYAEWRFVYIPPK